MRSYFTSLPIELQLNIVHIVLLEASDVGEGLVPLLVLLDAVDDGGCDNRVLFESLKTWSGRDPYFELSTVIRTGTPRVLFRVLCLRALPWLFGDSTHDGESNLQAALETRNERVLELTVTFVGTVDWDYTLEWAAGSCRHASVTAMLENPGILEKLHKKAINDALLSICSRHHYFSLTREQLTCDVFKREYLEGHVKCVDLLLRAGANPMVFVDHARRNIENQFGFENR